REAVGVVVDARLAAQRALQVGGKRPAVEPGGIGVSHEAGVRRQRTRDADADRAAASDRTLGLVDETGDRGARARVVAARCRHAPAQSLAARVVEREHFDLRAAEIDADPHALPPGVSYLGWPILRSLPLIRFAMFAL